ncbi:MAG: phosphoribosylglycinamide formyltransferase [Planctomycetota bacterium]|nr:MAG: phosphoribosylglycinamide formyltransferase [Planctomycetota bacterium]
MKNFAILISGRGSNMENLLRCYQRGELLARPVVVLSNTPKAPGLERAERYSIPTYAISWKNRERAESAAIEICQKFQVQFVVLAGFMKILTPLFLEHFPHKIINIHPSLLPAFPGKDAVKRALEYGVRFSGCTTHFVSAEVDRGPIILQALVPVWEEDTVETLARRILRQEHRILPKTVNLYSADALELCHGRIVRIFWDRLPVFYRKGCRRP